VPGLYCEEIWKISDMIIPRNSGAQASSSLASGAARVLAE
jgi:hypothetical protein